MSNEVIIVFAGWGLGAVIGVVLMLVRRLILKRRGRR